MITADLFSFAYIPTWFEQLYELSHLATPEPWRFKIPDHEMQNDQTPILERYINQVFRKQAVDYNYAPPEDADYIFYIRNEFACLHTGLYTPALKAIYMCFERNKKRDTLRQWYFKNFATEGSSTLKYVNPLPMRPAHALLQQIPYFDPEKEIRINSEHILQDDENVKRLPSPIRAAWNLPLLLETAVEMSRRKALVDWNLAVPQVFQNRIQYLLPIHLTLIMVNRKHDAANDMFYVSAVSSAVIYAVIVIVTVSMLLQRRRKMAPATRSDRC